MRHESSQSELERQLNACRPMALHLASRVVGKTEAEDVVQSVVVKVFEKYHTFDSSKAKFCTWFQRSVINAALDVKKSYWSRKIATGALGPSDSDAPDEDRQWLESAFTRSEASLEDQVLAKLELEQLLQSLSAEERAILALIAEGASYQELSELFGLPEGTIKMRVSRLRKRLAAQFESLENKEN